MSLGIYVHLPFCRVHCTYCAFAISTDLTLQDRYARAVVREIEERAGGEEVDSIYLGGGTPSRMSVENLSLILESVRSRFAVVAGAEVSMEANPEDVTAGSLEAWRDLEVNRLSIGVQSFRDAELQPLGRLHGSERGRNALAQAVVAGFRTNLDLILGLPGQTEESFLASIEQAAAVGAGHASIYMLDLEEQSPLRVQVARGRTTLPDEELVAALYPKMIERFAAAGLQQYEISNFARPGEECRHNLRYWTRGEYHGFGLAAHSFVAGRRAANTRDMRRYLEGGPKSVDFVEELGPDEVRRETIFLRLRQTSGIHYEELERLCGQEGLEWSERGLEEGWLRRVERGVAFTAAGFLLSNEYISRLF